MDNPLNLELAAMTQERDLYRNAFIGLYASGVTSECLPLMDGHTGAMMYNALSCCPTNEQVGEQIDRAFRLAAVSAV